MRAIMTSNITHLCKAKNTADNKAASIIAKPFHVIIFNADCRGSSSRKKKRNFWCYGSAVLMLIIGVAIIVGVCIGIGLNFGLKSTTLPSRITTSNLMSHLQVCTSYLHRTLY